jgi:pyruvate, water dikinase
MRGAGMRASVNTGVEMNNSGGSNSVLHTRTHDDWWWTTTNASEAIPGVLTPLGWTLWGPCGESAMRRVFHAIGGLPRSELPAPDNSVDRMINIFYGRIAINVDTFVRIGDAMPGTTGAAVAEQMLGFAPPGLKPKRSMLRYAAVASRFPVVFLRVPKEAARLGNDIDHWYVQTIGRIDELDMQDARKVFVQARNRFDEAVFRQTLCTIAGIQPIFEQLTALANSVDIDAGAIMAGYGSHKESQLLEDLWACSRDQIDPATVIATHGFHGPGEGEIGGQVWRQDPTPLLSILEDYRKVDEKQNPKFLAERNIERRLELERELLLRLPRSKKTIARLLLRLARRYVPLRGIGKAAFLQSLDLCRASALRIGALLVADGVLDDVDDVFYLSCEEMMEPYGGVRSLVQSRRAERAAYLDLELPVSWLGNPESIAKGSEIVERTNMIKGTGVSAGIVEGVARLIRDPGTDPMETGDVLVAATTDPSWVSVMFLASALVVDVGGQLSHAAIVARELGIPCVMGTVSGTKVIRDGDLCRVDGSAGTIEILNMVPEAS